MDAFWGRLGQKLAKKTNFKQGQLECDVWVGGREHSTYGKTTVTWPDGKKTVERAHRLAFMVATQTLRVNMPLLDAMGKKLEVSHLCHNSLCVKPAHIILESHETNLERITCSRQGHCSALHQPMCLI